MGNVKRVIGKDMIILNDLSINEIVSLLNDKDVDLNDVIIMVNGVESSLVDRDAKLKDEDIITIASITHGG